MSHRVLPGIWGQEYGVFFSIDNNTAEIVLRGLIMALKYGSTLNSRISVYPQIIVVFFYSNEQLFDFIGKIISSDKRLKFWSSRDNY